VGRALAGFVLGALLVLAAVGFAMHYGLLPSGVRILQIGGSGSSSSGSASTSAPSSSMHTAATTSTSTTSSGGDAGVVGSAVSYVFGRLAQYVAGSKKLVAAFFAWLLGSSLHDAVLNLAVVVIVAGALHWLLKFFRWVVAAVVVIGALLIVLRYALVVI
jgi:hypothetical protein